MLFDFTHDHDGERLSGVYGGDPSGVTAVVLHGAGTSSTERLLPLVREFVAHGCRGIAFDFSGHGESTGKLSELSLLRRFEQAVAVIDAYAGADGPLVLVGFSMSGQTVADLVRYYGDRVAALGLCAPAVYTAEAWEVPFGDGNGRFSSIIRRPDKLAGGTRASGAAGVRGTGCARRAGHRRGDPARGDRVRTGRADRARPVHAVRPSGRTAPARECGSVTTATTGGTSWRPC